MVGTRVLLCNNMYILHHHLIVCDGSSALQLLEKYWCQALEFGDVCVSDPSGIP